MRPKIGSGVQAVVSTTAPVPSGLSLGPEDVSGGPESVVPPPSEPDPEAAPLEEQGLAVG